MATNPSTLPENSGRITAPDANYPYGSAKDDSTGTTGDGTPIKKALLNDTYGIIQAALRAAGSVPSGNAETSTESQVLQAINGLASGLANNYTDTGAVDAYVLELKANQQKQPSLFDGLVVSFTAANANTGASTVDVSNILGQSPGTTVKNIARPGGAALLSGDVAARTALLFNLADDRFEVTDLRGAGGFLFSSTGYHIFESGLIVQWGGAGATASGNALIPVTFPIPFPTALLRVIIGDFDNGVAPAGGAYLNTTADTPAGTSIRFINATLGATDATYVAIGY